MIRFRPLNTEDYRDHRIYVNLNDNDKFHVIIEKKGIGYYLLTDELQSANVIFDNMVDAVDRAKADIDNLLSIS